MPETVQPASTRQTANAVRPGGGVFPSRRRRDERGAATAEYVIATMAAINVFRHTCNMMIA
jgi:hypothetical protein